MKFSINGYEFVTKINRFPSGELGVVLPKNLPFNIGRLTIFYDWVEYKDTGISLIAQLIDAIDRKYLCGYQKTLFLPYVPYSRQDRVCNKGESFSLKAFTSIINSFGFNQIVTLDNHSDVATALINNCVNVPQESLLAGSGVGAAISQSKSLLVSPDNGAIKKTRAVAKFFGADKIIRCDKERDIATGKIISTSVLDKDTVIEYSDFLVVDDICDGGGTFIGLGGAIKELNPNAKLSLYITHGFFTKGLEPLLRHYDRIYTTNSVCRIEHDKLTIIKEI